MLFMDPRLANITAHRKREIFIHYGRDAMIRRRGKVLPPNKHNYLISHFIFPPGSSADESESVFLVKKEGVHT